MSCTHSSDVSSHLMGLSHIPAMVLSPSPGLSYYDSAVIIMVGADLAFPVCQGLF